MKKRAISESMDINITKVNG